MADKKKMSLDDILAACRKPASGEAAATPPASKEPPAAAAEATEPTAPAPVKPAAEKPASPKPAVKPGAMSVADIMAAARAGKAAAPAVEAKKEAPVEPKPKPAAAAKPKAEGKPASGFCFPVGYGQHSWPWLVVRQISNRGPCRRRKPRRKGSQSKRKARKRLPSHRCRPSPLTPR